MSTPNKRRKKNDYKAPSSTVRNLDHFFGKPGASKSATAAPVRNLDDFFGKQRTNGPADRASAATVSSPVLVEPGTSQDPKETATLTDEELARSLQEEWNKEDAGPGISDSSSFAQTTKRNDSFPVEAQEAEEELYVQEQDQLADTDQGQHQKDKDKVDDEGQAMKKNHPPATKTSSLALQSTSSTEDEITLTIPFDESALVFDPAKYIPALQAHWKSHGNDASYALLTRCFVLVNSTQSRIKIVDTLVNFLRLIIEADPDSLLSAVSSLFPSSSSHHLIIIPGVAGNQLDRASIYFDGARDRWLGHLESTQTSLRS